jgi:DNA topoisomerase-1
MSQNKPQNHLIDLSNPRGGADGPPLEPEVVAHAAGLRYVSDTEPGLTRQRCGRGFRFLDRNGNPVTDRYVLERARSLVIPPAWTDVWICGRADGHIQVTGKDARGRKQYIYHPDWRAARDETKYHRMRMFGALLPDIRAHVERDMQSHSAGEALAHDRVVASLVRLLDQTAIRIGNERYVRDNQSFGLTTLRAEHVEVAGATLRLHFRGKSGKELSLSVKDRRVSNVIRKLQDLPGQCLFRYRTESGELRPIDSGDVNEYLMRITGQHVTAKDFRTWTASTVAAEALTALLDASGCVTKADLNRGIDEAARRLGNTRTVCRSSYIHPDIFLAYQDGWITEVWKAAYLAAPPDGLHPEETAMLAVLTHAEAVRPSKTADAA